MSTFDDANAVLDELAEAAAVDERLADERAAPPVDEPEEEVWRAILDLGERLGVLESRHAPDPGRVRRTALELAVNAAAGMPWVTRENTNRPPWPLAGEERRAWIVATAQAFIELLEPTEVRIAEAGGWTPPLDAVLHPRRGGLQFPAGPDFAAVLGQGETLPAGD